MNLTYGIIVAVGLLIAAILGMIAIDPGHLDNAPVIPQSEKPTVCTKEYAPVCGVDDKTYGNSCMLKSAKVDLAYKGECVAAGETPSTETKPIPVKPIMAGWDRLESVQDPGIGHEQHQLAVILPPSDKVYSGKLEYDASENIQLVALHGPLAEGEDKGQAIWTPDGTTKFALTFVDPMNAKGEWIFAGNALAVHTKNPTPFTVDYKVDYTEKAQSDTVMTGTIQSVQDPGMGHESHQLAVILPPSSDVYSGILSYSASEPIQLVSLRGPIGPDEHPEKIWTPDGETIFELTLVDPANAMGSWEFSGNALAVHTKNPTEFTVSYSVSATATAGEPAPEPETPTMGMPVLPQIRDVSIPEGSSTPGCEQTNECFMPNSLQVNVGDTVTWTNEDTAAHTVTSGTPVDGPSGLFDSGLLVAGSTFDFTFNETGTYPYFCIVHPWMKGEIKVSEFKETEVFGEEISEPPMEEPVVEEKRASMPEVSISQGSGAPGCEKTNECFIPYQLEVFSGESVIWKNPDSAAHTVTSGVPGSPNGMFDSGMLMPNQTFEFHFVESGEYDYYCMVHPWMTGKVIVN